MSKEFIGNQFLDFVSRYQPLTQATFATLGGKGIEAAIWKARGIPLHNGWQIERGRELRKSLMGNDQYGYHNSLKSFPASLRSVSASPVGIDGFHIDLSETLETNRELLDSCLPLIFSSKAKCLALTVPDQRYNPTLNHWPQVEKFLVQRLGKENLNIFLSQLEQERSEVPVFSKLPPFFVGSDVQKSSRKEVGVFRILYQWFEDHQFRNLPDTVERFTYVSRYGKRPFRMKTYFLHFREAPTDSAHRVAYLLLQLWLKSSLFVIVDGTIVRNPKETSMSLHTPDFPALDRLVEAAGGQALVEYRQLISMYQQRSESAVTLDQIRTLVRVVPVTPVEAHIEPPAKPIKCAPKKREQGKKRIIAPAIKMSRKDTLHIQLKLVRSMVLGEKAQKKTLAEASSLLGQKATQTARATAYKARTQGKFLPDFIKSIIKIEQEKAPSIIAELAPIYGAIQKKTITVTDLMAMTNSPVV